MTEIVDVIDGQEFSRAEPIDCPLCGASNAARRITAAFGMVASVAECPPCRLAYQTPLPTEEATAAYMNWRWLSDDSYVGDTASKRRAARRQLTTVQRARPDATALLDFGAGSGTFVHAAREAGIRAVGVERSESAIQRAKEFYGVDLLRDLPNERFDVVTLWDVVEHLRDPVPILSTLRDRLAEDGVILMATGNYECWQRLVAGDDWSLYLLDHHFYFTPHSLETVARRAGFADFELLDVNHAAPPLRHLLKRPRWYGQAIRAYRSTMTAWPRHGDIHIMACLAKR